MMRDFGLLQLKMTHPVFYLGLIFFCKASEKVLFFYAMQESLHDRVTFEAGSDIFLEGSDALFMYVIEKGNVEVWKTYLGEKKILAKLGSGRVFGEMALINKTKRTASVTALEYTVCIRISEKRLNEVLLECSSFVRALLKILVSNLKSIQDEFYTHE